MLGLTPVNLLGIALRKRKNGDRNENLDQAIEHCKLALEVHTRQDYPEKWAMHQAFLGLLILERKRGERAAYLGEAISHFQAAQEVYTQEQYPQEWANVQAGMLAAYRERDQADKPPQLTYPQFYEQESRLQAGNPCSLHLDYAVIPDFPYFMHLILLYRWEADLPDQEAQKLAQRAIAYVSCAIYDAAQAAGLSCWPSPIPNGRRPACCWKARGHRYP